jgi:hypothetical protein
MLKKTFHPHGFERRVTALKQKVEGSPVVARKLRGL